MRRSIGACLKCLPEDLRDEVPRKASIIADPNTAIAGHPDEVGILCIGGEGEESTTVTCGACTIPYQGGSRRRREQAPHKEDEWPKGPHVLSVSVCHG